MIDLEAVNREKLELSRQIAFEEAIKAALSERRCGYGSSFAGLLFYFL